MNRVLRFRRHQLPEALAWVDKGGISLHVMKKTPGSDGPNPPGTQVGHLMGKDAIRLVALSSFWGIRNPKIHQPRSKHQHIELWGDPLLRAEAEAVAYVPIDLVAKAAGLSVEDLVEKLDLTDR